MKTSQKILRLLRKIHLCVGLFTAPALLFFSFTGAMQTFSLHETSPGSSYTPPKWLVALGQLHKKQTTIVPVRNTKPVTASSDAMQSSIADSRPGRPAENPAQSRKSADAPSLVGNRHLPMKIFFVLVATGLAVSTLSGIFMAWKSTRPLLVMSLLAAGAVVPCLLLAF
jgi:hypothetical protein